MPESSVRLALLLYAFGVMGLFLLVAPWTGVWNHAIVSVLPTRLGSWALSGWARGLVSGLGALNLVVGTQIAAELWRAVRAERRPAADE